LTAAEPWAIGRRRWARARLKDRAQGPLQMSRVQGDRRAVLLHSSDPHDDMPLYLLATLLPSPPRAPRPLAPNTMLQCRAATVRLCDCDCDCNCKCSCDWDCSRDERPQSATLASHSLPTPVAAVWAQTEDRQRWWTIAAPSMLSIMTRQPVQRRSRPAPAAGFQRASAAFGIRMSESFDLRLRFRGRLACPGRVA